MPNAATYRQLVAKCDTARVRLGTNHAKLSEPVPPSTLASGGVRTKVDRHHDTASTSKRSSGTTSNASRSEALTRQLACEDYERKLAAYEAATLQHQQQMAAQAQEAAAYQSAAATNANIANSNAAAQAAHAQAAATQAGKEGDTPPPPPTMQPPVAMPPAPRYVPPMDPAPVPPPYWSR